MVVLKEKSGCDARKGALVIGIVLCIINSFLMLASFGALVFVNVELNLEWNIKRPALGSIFTMDNFDSFLLLISNAPILAVFFISMIDVAFSIILAHGASKRYAGHLKAYFTYGIVKSVKLFIMSISLYCTFDYLSGSVPLILCGLNIMLTHMVYVAYSNINKLPKGYSKFHDDIVVTTEK